jgi:hypothetical protein
MFTTLATDIDAIIPVLAVGGGLVIGLVVIVGGLIRGTLISRAREQSRREVAAYIAEGSMTAEEGARILEAGMPHGEKRR